MSSCRTGIYFFYSLLVLFYGVHDLKVLDEKSKQKNQAKIIPAFALRALKPGAIFAGPRALLFLKFENIELIFT